VTPLGQRWCRAIPPLRVSGLRVAFLRHELELAAPDLAARALDEICSRAEQADPRAREVLTAALPVFADPSFEAFVRAYRAVALRESLLALGRLLRRTAPPRAREADGVPPEEARPRAARALTLGERKALARRPSRAHFDKLLRDQHPMVIRTLLENPRLTEEDVVRICARRPACPDATVEIARSAKWAARLRVRMAVVLNPGSPAEVSVPMLGLLIRPELEEVLRAADVPAVVRATAQDLLDRRPPPAPPRGPWRLQ
jgi:hypothetical protein